MYKCRYPRCEKTFSVKGNCRCHERNERVPCHQKEEFSLQRRQRAVTPFFDNNLRFLESWFSYRSDHNAVVFKLHACTFKFL